MKVQGKHGTGKSFVINTQNITNIDLKCNKYDIATTLTGCDASLVDDKTHIRSLNVPVSRKIFNALTCYTPSSLENWVKITTARQEGTHQAKQYIFFRLTRYRYSAKSVTMTQIVTSREIHMRK